MNKMKPKYTIWQNVQYMLGMVWTCKVYSVVVFCVLASILKILSSLTGILITPMILRCVEAQVPFVRLFITILVFAGMLMIWSGLSAYVECVNSLADRADIRRTLMQTVMKKNCTTSYPNLEDQNVLWYRRQAEKAVRGSGEATEGVWNTLSDIIKNIGGFFIYLFMLTAVNPVVIVITMVTAVLGYLVNRYAKRWRYQHKDEVADYELKTWYILRKSQDMTLAKDLRLFGMENWLKDIYASVMILYRGYFFRRERIYLLTDIVNVVLTFLRNGIAYGYLIYMVFNQNLPISEFLLYFATVGGFTAWIGGIFDSFGILHEQSLDLSMMREYLEMQEVFWEESERDKREDIPACKESCSLELRGVSFRYPGAKEDTIHNLDLVISPGEKLAIVGMNGAGKTTLVKLLCGFYNPTEGEVLYNGIDIRKFDRREYYSLFSAVFQKFSVLETTLAENVAQTYDSIDMERVERCIEKAGLKRKVEALPNGYQTYIGKRVFLDGVELSGGEIQKLMLARALYKDSPILILDEPTAALDPIAENDMYQRYDQMTRSHTSVYISHRLASTRFCDRIIYLKNGRIAESGTHEELLRAGGGYARLYEMQSKYYREGTVDGEKG